MVRALPLLVLLLVAPGLAAEATSGERGGDVVPLAPLLDELEGRYHGTVIEVELDEEGRDAPRYLIEMLGPEGQKVTFRFDAREGELTGIQGVGIDGMQRE